MEATDLEFKQSALASRALKQRWQEHWFTALGAGFFKTSEEQCPKEEYKSPQIIIDLILLDALCASALKSAIDTLPVNVATLFLTKTAADNSDSVIPSDVLIVQHNTAEAAVCAYLDKFAAQPESRFYLVLEGQSLCGDWLKQKLVSFISRNHLLQAELPWIGCTNDWRLWPKLRQSGYLSISSDAEWLHEVAIASGLIEGHEPDLANLTVSSQSTKKTELKSLSSVTSDLSLGFRDSFGKAEADLSYLVISVLSHSPVSLSELQLLHAAATYGGRCLILLVSDPVFITPETELWTLIKSGMFSRVLVSGQQSAFFQDATEFLKRLPDAPFVLMDWAALDQNSTALWRLLLTSRDDPSLSYASSRTGDLRSVLAMACDSVSSWFAYLNDGIWPDPISQTLEVTKTDKVFVTHQGLARFGGYAKFKTLPFRFGARQDACSANYVVVGAQQNSEDALVFPEYIELEGNRHLLIDINPAPSVEPSLQIKPGSFSLPRTVMTINRVSYRLPENSERSVIFVVSNHNKQSYLAGSLYSLLMQTYSSLKVELWDDGSTDMSVFLATQLQRYIKVPCLSVHRTDVSRGTYWIRNRVATDNPDAVYLVNDSDDYSCAQRVVVQLGAMNREQDIQVVLADVIRTNSAGWLLELEDVTEHYGSATLLAESSLHRKTGYYQHVYKAADTEFIHRLRRFWGPEFLNWVRYPVLFQPFDGKNLTADIYSLSSERRQLQQSLHSREQYSRIYDRFHRFNQLQDIVDAMKFVEQKLPQDYKSLPQGFVPEIFIPDCSLSVQGRTCLSGEELFGMITEASKQLLFTIAAEGIVVRSDLPHEKHQYIELSQGFHLTLFGKQASNGLVVKVLFSCNGELDIRLVLSFMAADGSKISHKFLQKNTEVSIRIPLECSEVKFSLRVQGKGEAIIQEVSW